MDTDIDARAGRVNPAEKEIDMLINHNEVIEELRVILNHLSDICDKHQDKYSVDDCKNCPLAIMNKGEEIDICIANTVSNARLLLMADEGKLRQIESLIQDL